MHADEKMTFETWPAEPERSTLEAKNKFIGFWLFLGERPFYSPLSLPHILH